MNLSFKEWLIAEVKKKQLPIHQNMKQWVKSVENLEKELETLKAVFKSKKIDIKKDDKTKDDKTKDDKTKDDKTKDDKTKDVTKKINVIDKKLDATKKINVIDKKLDATKKDQKPGDKKPEDKHELPSGEKQVPKPAPYLRKGKENIKEPTKVDKDQSAKSKKINGNDRPS
jgi:hypothetical protein